VSIEEKVARPEGMMLEMGKRLKRFRTGTYGIDGCGL